jgi:hypothetical protein
MGVQASNRGDATPGRQPEASLVSKAPGSACARRATAGRRSLVLARPAKAPLKLAALLRRERGEESHEVGSGLLDVVLHRR